MGGFLKHVLIPEDFAGRVLNIHPSLLPSFGGQGMYGLRVHEAVLAAGVSTSGCTVHFVDNEYDHGPILLQRQVPVQQAILRRRCKRGCLQPNAKPSLPRCGNLPVDRKPFLNRALRL